jgi:hypothetical protein
VGSDRKQPGETHLWRKTMTRWKTLVFAAVFAAALPGGTVSAVNWQSGGAEKCDDAVNARLDEMNIDRADITKTSYVRRMETRSGDTVTVGYDVWITLNSCGSSLIIDVTRDCRVRQVYTRGECKMEGLKHFR